MYDICQLYQILWYSFICVQLFVGFNIQTKPKFVNHDLANNFFSEGMKGHWSFTEVSKHAFILVGLNTTSKVLFLCRPGVHEEKGIDLMDSFFFPILALLVLADPSIYCLQVFVFLF